jgi:hypothetical protein
MFKLSESNPEYYALSGNMLASALMTGSFGKLDEQEFLRVASLLGDDLNIQMKHKVQSIKKYYAYKKQAPKALETLVSETINYCTDNSIAITIAKASDNEALHYIHTNECLIKFLKRKKEVRSLYAKYLKNIASRSTSLARAQGFLLYDTSSDQYAALSKEQQHSLLSAKEQVYAYNSNRISPLFKLSTKPGELESMPTLELIKKLTSLGNEDLVKNIKAIDDLVPDIQQSSIMKSKTMPLVLYTIVARAVDSKNLEIFDRYVKKMVDNSYLTQKNINYFNQLRVIIMSDNKDYLTGLSFVDTLI